jgi:hypothetical protein
MSVGFVVFSFGGLMPAAVLFLVPAVMLFGMSFAGEAFLQNLSLSLLSFSSLHLRVRQAFSRFSHSVQPVIQVQVLM